MGGPDHQLTYASVELTLIAVFRKLDLDYLCASRTASHHSFRNSDISMTFVYTAQEMFHLGQVQKSFIPSVMTVPINPMLLM